MFYFYLKKHVERKIEKFVTVCRYSVIFGGYNFSKARIRCFNLENNLEGKNRKFITLSIFSVFKWTE